MCMREGDYLVNCIARGCALEVARFLFRFAEAEIDF